RVTLADDRVVEGSGFFAGGGNIILTNGHVLGMLSPDGRPPQKIEVTLDSGQPGERKVLARLLQVDPGADLAALAVDAPQLPAPLPIASAKDLLETEAVFIFGFPFGKQLGRNITVSRTSVSSMRRNPAGHLREVQVNGGMHPGNSGGPVIDARGQVVGVATYVIKDSQIHFAIAGDVIHSFLNTSMHVRVFLSPYKEGNVLKLPMRFRMVDPLSQITKVTVEAWTGKPGESRKPVAKIGVEPLPGDAPRRSFEFQYKDHVATGDVILPAIPSDQALWIQLSYTKRGGGRTWTAAVTYHNKFAPVERKPVTLAYQHRPEYPCKLELTATTDLKLRGPDSTDQHLVQVFKAQMVEKTMGKPDGGNAMLGAISFTRVESKTTLDKKELPGDEGFQNSLNQAKALLAQIQVDKQGDLQPLKIAAAVSNQATREDLLWVGVRTLMYLEAVSTPLPGMEVSHDKPWKAQRKLLLGSSQRSQPAVVDVTYIYHGTRLRDGHTEALVFLQGEVRGPKEAAASVAGRMDGLAVVDLKTNQVHYAEANLNLDLDLDLGSGSDSLQANGTLKLILMRTPLTGAERDNVAKNKDPAAPAVDQGGKPAGVITTVASGEMFAFLKQSVSAKKTVEAGPKGLQLGTKPFRETCEQGGILIGFEVGLKPAFGADMLDALRPLYLTKDGEKRGAWYGTAPAKPVTVKAKPGYVVNGITLRTGLLINGFSLQCTKLGKDRLQVDDSYESEWIGDTKGGNKATIGGNGGFVVGVCGHLNDRTTVCALGLLTVAFAQEPGSGGLAQDKSWVGEAVLPTKPNKDIKFWDRVDGKEVQLSLSGIMPYAVRDERKTLLRIHDGYREGWVDKADFVLGRDAVAHFQRLVQADPSNPWPLFMRGIAWLHTDEVDNAIKDFTEGIRLDPTAAGFFMARGNAWRRKKEFDKAIKDYDEAIRLDFNLASPFINRATVWLAKQEFDKAIEDFDEAI
ncbi:MAG TPA: tetratricopeptide repeat-containing serine protease family protein, partial [Gemmataceae bacterium]|nr:tetratricopeptide repeat-containing serine protease family protein [Gemmataceae bacterium]